MRGSPLRREGALPYGPRPDESSAVPLPELPGPPAPHAAHEPKPPDPLEPPVPRLRLRRHGVGAVLQTELDRRRSIDRAGRRGEEERRRERRAEVDHAREAVPADQDVALLSEVEVDDPPRVDRLDERLQPLEEVGAGLARGLVRQGSPLDEGHRDGVRVHPSDPTGHPFEPLEAPEHRFLSPEEGAGEGTPEGRGAARGLDDTGGLPPPEERARRLESRAPCQDFHPRRLDLVPTRRPHAIRARRAPISGRRAMAANTAITSRSIGGSWFSRTSRREKRRPSPERHGRTLGTKSGTAASYRSQAPPNFARSRSPSIRFFFGK